MKRVISLACIAVLIAVVSSCKNNNGSGSWATQNESTNPEEFMKSMSNQFTDFMSNEFQKFIDDKINKKAPVKKPSFSEKEAKKELDYMLLLNGQKEASCQIQIGHFEVNEDDLQVYALLADNGLITLSTKAIKKDGSNNYSIWADVALTSKGKKYISDDSIYDDIKGLDKLKYKDVLNPAKDRNAYGELEEEPVNNPDIINLFNSFYGELVSVGEKKALKEYGEEEFAEAYTRILKLDSYLKVLEVATQVPEKAFTAGDDVDASIINNLRVVKVTKYQNCYKVYFNNGHSVIFILTPDNAQIFDLVIDTENKATVRTKNAAWTNADIAIYAEMAAAPVVDVTTEEDLGLEKIWNAPGLIEVGERDKSRYVYPVEKAYAIQEFVSVRLFQRVVDKIYNVKVTTAEAPEDKGNDYNYTANATVVYKKVNITPFQLVLQKAGAIEPIGKADIYEKNIVTFVHYDDRAWGLVSDSNPGQGKGQSNNEPPYPAGFSINGSGIFDGWD